MLPMLLLLLPLHCWLGRLGSGSEYGEVGPEQQWGKALLGGRAGGKAPWVSRASFPHPPLATWLA